MRNVWFKKNKKNTKNISLEILFDKPTKVSVDKIVLYRSTSVGLVRRTRAAHSEQEEDCSSDLVGIGSHGTLSQMLVFSVSVCARVCFPLLSKFVYLGMRCRDRERGRWWCGSLRRRQGWRRSGAGSWQLHGVREDEPVRLGRILCPLVWSLSVLGSRVGVGCLNSQGRRASCQGRCHRARRACQGVWSPELPYHSVLHRRSSKALHGRACEVWHLEKARCF